MKLRSILLAVMLGGAALSATAQEKHLPCADLVRLEVARNLLGGPVTRMSDNKPSDRGNLVCSFVRQDATPAAVSLVMGPADLWPKAFAGYKDKQRIVKMDDVAILGKDGAYFRAALTEPKKGWNGLPIYGVKASAKGRHYLLNMQVEGGDEALIREYLVETMKGVIQKGP
jgi:hypothetical protein